jgi:signal recognition particle subunit SRP72
MASAASAKKVLDARQFSRLATLVRSDNLNRAVILANKMLAASPTDVDLVRTKCVCLIWLSRFDEALDMCGLLPTGILSYERAYCLYKLNRLDEARACIAASSLSVSSSVPALHLCAQIEYRSGDFTRAAKLYADLLDRCTQSPMDSNSNAELTSNYLAACIGCDMAPEGLDRLQKVAASGQMQGTSFELEFNHACALVAVGDLSAAVAKLAEARIVGTKLLVHHEYEADEIASELACVDVQQGFVEQLGGTGNVDETARKLYAQALKNKPTDSAVVAAASNNLFVSRGHRDLFDSYKRTRQPALASDALAKFPAADQRAIRRNRALLLLYMNKGDECRAAVEQLDVDFPDDDFATVALAALYLQQKKVAKCFEFLSGSIAKAVSPDSRVRLQLALAQVHVTQDDLPAAVAILEAIIGPPVGVVGALAAVHEQLGAIERSIETFDQAISVAQNEHKSVASERRLHSLLSAQGHLYLRHGRHTDAAKCFRTIVDECGENNSNSDDDDNDSRAHALSSLVMALSHFDQAAAEKYACTLPLPSGIDSVTPAQLENDVLPQLLNTRRKRKPVLASNDGAVNGGDDDAGTKRSAAQVASRERKRLKKKGKFIEILKARHAGAVAAAATKEAGGGGVVTMAIDFDAHVPNADRWLPRAERAGQRKFRRRRSQHGRATGAQGAGDLSARDAAKFDVREAAKKREADEARKAEEQDKAAAANRKKQQRGGKKGR